MYIYLFLFLNFLSYPKEGTFCSCRQPEPINREEIKDNDVILRGLVKKINTVYDQKLITINIKQVYKGTLEDKTITVSTPTDLSMCGLNIGTGREWLLFAYERNGDYSTNSCTRSGLLNSNLDWVRERIEKDIEFLDQLN